MVERNRRRVETGVESCVTAHTQEVFAEDDEPRLGFVVLGIYENTSPVFMDMTVF